jgi:hypothetical protein
MGLEAKAARVPVPHWDTLFSDFESEVKFHLKTVSRAERKRIVDYFIDCIADIECHAEALNAADRPRRTRRTPPKTA